MLGNENRNRNNQFVSFRKWFEIITLFILVFYRLYIIAITCISKAFHDLDIWQIKPLWMNWNLCIKVCESENYIVLFLADYPNLFNQQENKVHKFKCNTNPNWNWSSLLIFKLNEVIIRFVNHLASTSKLLNWQGC